MSHLPKAATRTRKKKTSDSEDEDYVAVEDEATSRKKVLKKEYGTAAATKLGMKTKAPARRIPMSKARASTVEASKSKKVATGETMKFTIESEEEAAGEDKKKKRARTTTAKVLGKTSMRIDSEEEEEEEDAAPAPKAQKLMGDAIKSGAAPSKPKAAPEAAAPAQKPAPKRNTRSIPAEEKNKAPVPEAADDEEYDTLVLRKLMPKIPDNNDVHIVAEDMKLRKDARLRL